MIYLIGFMGSGKSTIASRLSEDMQIPSVEMDAAIEEAEGMKISEMFAIHGESYFRERETEFLTELKGEAVVSTGGGVVLRKQNRELIQKGTVVYLKAEWETIVERLKEDTDRPLWQGDEAEKKKRFAERLHVYEQTADLIISVDGKTPEEVTEEIIKRLK